MIVTIRQISTHQLVPLTIGQSAASAGHALQDMRHWRILRVAFHQARRLITVHSTPGVA